MLTETVIEADANVYLDEASGRYYGIDDSGNTYWLEDKKKDNTAEAVKSRQVLKGTKRVTVDTNPNLSDNPIYTDKSSVKGHGNLGLEKAVKTFPRKRSKTHFSQRRLDSEDGDRKDTKSSIANSTGTTIILDDNSGKYYKVLADGTSEWLDGDIYPDEASGMFYRVLPDGTTEWV